MYAEYTRAKWNLIDVLTELGGLFNTFFLGGFAFTIAFSYNLMMSSLIRQLYFFRAKFPSELEKEKVTFEEKNKKKDGDQKKKVEEDNDSEDDEAMRAFNEKHAAEEA